MGEKMSDAPKSAIERLDRMFPLHFQEKGAFGLGQFIRIILESPSSPETKAEVLAIAIIEVFDLIEEADTI
jgi:hypothetical protein